MSIGSIGGADSAWPAQQSSPAQGNIANRTSGAGHHHHHHGGGGGGGIDSLLSTDDTTSTDATDNPLGPSAATPTTDDGGLSFADQLSSATSESSLLTAQPDLF